MRKLHQIVRQDIVRLIHLDDESHYQRDAQAHPLSPQSPDIAVSSFSSFHGVTLDNAPDTRRIVAHHPPSYIQQAQNNNTDISDIGLMEPLTRSATSDSADDLFAKALSPRTPDLPRSPFSFSPAEVTAGE